MSFGPALIAGFLIGALFAWARRLGTRRTCTDGAVILKWATGIGRATVVERRRRTLRVSAPAMRENYSTPAQGSPVLVRPLGGGVVQSAKFARADESGWTVRLSS